MLYAWTSATENNGSAMAGITGEVPLLAYGQAIAMLLGRFAFMIPVLAIAGSLAAKPKLPASAGTFPTHGPLFIGLLIGVIIILGGLQFMPADSLGPLAEHYVMLAGKTSRDLTWHKPKTSRCSMGRSSGAPRRIRSAS